MSVMSNLGTYRPAISFRLLRIEARRSAGLLLFPALVLLAGWLAYGQLPGVPLWISSVVVARDAVLLIGPVAGGLAAWAAARERMRGAEDLLLSTARPASARRLTTALGTALWALLAYTLVAAGILGWTYYLGAWGSPTLWPVLSGLLGVLACASLGFASGVWVRSRFTPPLVAVVLFFLLYYPNGLFEGNWIRWLSPGIWLNASVYQGFYPDLGLRPALFLGGLSLCALAAVALRGERGGAARGALVVGAGLAATGMWMTHAAHYTPGGYLEDRTASIPHTPVCREAAVMVCVHPAYSSLLGDLSREFNQMLEPLAGLQGVPTRAEMRGTAPHPDEAEGVLYFIEPEPVGPAATDRETQILQLTSLHDIMRDPNAPQPVDPAALGPGGQYTPWIGAEGAQEAISAWIQNRGYPFHCDQSSEEYVAVCRAAERFDRLGPARQRAWLEANWADLRAYKVRLEDLP